MVAQAIVAYRSLAHGELDEESASSSRGEKAKSMVEEALNSVRDGEPGFISIVSHQIILLSTLQFF